MKHYLTIDLGASSARIIVVNFDNQNKKIFLDEILRFNDYIIKSNENKLLYWNLNKIFNNIKKGIKESFNKYPDIISIGIDSWGVDYAYLDINNKILDNPRCYRNIEIKKVISEVYEKIDKFNLYQETGIQELYFNTIFQIYYDKKFNPLFKKANKVLLIPDLIAFLLTGVMKLEVTNLSTTSLYNYEKSCFINLNKLEINNNIFPNFIYPLEEYGYLKDDLVKELNIKKIKVVAVCSHDTASAINSINCNNKTCYLSSGTWSLFGTLLNEKNVSKKAYEFNYTNERGFNNKVRFLKNIMGLWILNNLKKDFKDDFISNYDMNKKAKDIEINTYIDPDDKLFENPDSMKDAIDKFLLQTNQQLPNNFYEYVKMIYQSLALKYKYNYEILKEITNINFDKLYIVGGGSNIDILNQLTSNYLNIRVYKGAQEATVLGNSLILLLNNKDIKNMEEGHEIIDNSIDVKVYEPNIDINIINNEYKNFLKILEMRK